MLQSSKSGFGPFEIVPDDGEQSGCRVVFQDSETQEVYALTTNCSGNFIAKENVCYISSGSSGKVFAVTGTKGTAVAVKEFEDEDFFQDEEWALSALQAPASLGNTVFEQFFVQGAILQKFVQGRRKNILVMQLARGGGIDDAFSKARCNRLHSRSPECLAFFTQMCIDVIVKSCMELGARGLFYFDLKLENALVSSEWDSRTHRKRYQKEVLGFGDSLHHDATAADQGGVCGSCRKHRVLLCDYESVGRTEARGGSTVISGKATYCPTYQGVTAVKDQNGGTTVETFPKVQDGLLMLSAKDDVAFAEHVMFDIVCYNLLLILAKWADTMPTKGQNFRFYHRLQLVFLHSTSASKRKYGALSFVRDFPKRMTELTGFCEDFFRATDLGRVLCDVLLESGKSNPLPAKPRKLKDLYELWTNFVSSPTGECSFNGRPWVTS